LISFSFYGKINLNNYYLYVKYVQILLIRRKI